MPDDAPPPQLPQPSVTKRALFTAAVTTGIIAAAAAYAVYLAPANQRGEFFVRTLSIFVSWPFVVALLGLTFGVTFRSEIATYIAKARIKFPGGTEIESLQQVTAPQSTNEIAVKAIAEQSTNNEELEQLRVRLETTSKQAQGKDEEVKKLSDGLEIKNRVIGLWKSRFFNVYLAPKTKEVLQWFVNSIPLAVSRFHDLWTPYIPDPANRQSILDALTSYNLLDVNDGHLTISELGRTYLETEAAWRALQVAPRERNAAALAGWSDAIGRLGELS